MRWHDKIQMSERLHVIEYTAYLDVLAKLEVADLRPTHEEHLALKAKLEIAKSVMIKIQNIILKAAISSDPAIMGAANMKALISVDAALKEIE